MVLIRLSLVLLLATPSWGMMDTLRGLFGGHTAPQDCSKIRPKFYKQLLHVKESAVGSGAPPFPCVFWYNAKAAGTVQKDTELSAEDKDVIQAPMLGGHGYAGDGKYSDNCNSLLGGRQLSEWNQPPGGVGDWAKYYGISTSGKELTQWPDQILNFAKKLAGALNKLPDTKMTVYRGGWAKQAQMEAMKVGDVQKKAGFVSTSADKGWAQGFAHDYHYPRSGPRGDTKEPGYVSVMYTIDTVRAKDIRRLNERESELILLPNTKLRVKAVKLEANMPFATYSPEKVAKWLRAFVPPMEIAAEHVVNKKVTGNQILEAYACGSFFGAQELICDGSKMKPNKWGGKDFVNPECSCDTPFCEPKYLDADGEKKSLYVMLKGDGKGNGEFAGMFKQKYKPLASAGRVLNAPSKVGMFYAVEMEQVAGDATKETSVSGNRL